MKENTSVVVIGELTKNELASHTYELATLANNLGSNIKVVVSASSDFNSEHAVTELGPYGIDELHVLNTQGSLSASGVAKYVQNNLIADKTIIVGPQTYIGRDILAHLSAYLDKPVLSNAVSVENSDGIKTRHAIFGGTKIVTAQNTTESPHLVLVRPKSVEPIPSTAKNTVVTAADVQALVDESAKTEITNTQEIVSEGPELDQAKVVISGGRGLGSQENYETLIEGTASLIGAATGASRAIVDAGWVPYSKQVGQTGKTVTPEVYIACGISGATQHVVGIKGAKNIIAINTDDQAPIFDIADLGVVADVNVVMAKLIEKIKQA